MHPFLSCTIGNPLVLCPICKGKVTKLVKQWGIVDTPENRLHLVSILNTSYGLRIRYHGQSKAWAKRNGKAYHKHGH